jgi:hypothetical protein
MPHDEVNSAMVAMSILYIDFILGRTV